MQGSDLINKMARSITEIRTAGIWLKLSVNIYVEAEQ